VSGQEKLMKKSSFVIATVFLIMCATSASAQVARVFLAGSGDDGNNCSDITTPCRSLQGAVTQCPVKGEVIIIASGGFGTATITQSLTINAPAGVVAFNAREISVNIGATDKVVIRGLSLNGAVFGDPHGIYFGSGGTLIVENCLVSGFGNGIGQYGLGGKLVVNNSEFRNNTSDGIFSDPATGTMAYLTVENCRFENNGNAGVDVSNWVTAVVKTSVSTNNNWGYELGASVASGGSLTLDTCVASYSTVAGIASAGNNQVPAIIRVTRSTVVGNAIGLEVFGVGQIVSYGTNQVWANTIGDGSFSSTVPTI
jgi:hypothetical protein